jgi:cyanate permease
VLVVACLLAGIAGALRGLAGSFATLSVTFFLFGLVTATIPPVVHKTCGVWFSGRHLGLANGVVSMGMAIGFTVGAAISATWLSPTLGGWRNVLFLYAGISVFVSILWMLTRSEPGFSKSLDSGPATVPFRDALSRVIRNRRVWLLSFVLVGQVGCVQGLLGYLPLYLRDVGWAPASADGALATFHAVSIVGTIPLALLAAKLSSRNVVLFAAVFLTALGTGLLTLATGALVWVAVVMAGVVRDGFMAVMMTRITEIPGVGVAYAGTAMGIAFTLSRLIGFASPPIGNSLATQGTPGLPFLFWSALATVALFAFVLLRRQQAVLRQ